MECRAVVSSLSDYLDGRNIWVSDDEIEQIETHLTNCPTCRNLKLELSELKNAARELPLHTPPPALWTRISKAIEAEISTENRPVREAQNALGWWGWLNSRKFTFSLPQLAAAGAFAAILIVAGISGVFDANSVALDFPGRPKWAAAARRKRDQSEPGAPAGRDQRAQGSMGFAEARRFRTAH